MLRCGEDHPAAKLSVIEVQVIRSLVRQGFNQVWIAQRYEVTQQNISLIYLRKTWKHVKL